MSDYNPVGAPSVLADVPPEYTPVDPYVPPVEDPPYDAPPVNAPPPPVDVCEYIDTSILDCPII